MNSNNEQAKGSAVTNEEGLSKIWIRIEDDSISTVQQLAVDSIAKEYGIQFEKKRPTEIVDSTNIKQQNLAYFDELKSVLGENWKKDFDKKVIALEKSWQQNWESKKCQEDNNQQEYQFSNTCTLANTDLTTAYLLYRQNNLLEDTGKYLEHTTPSKDLLIKNNKDGYPLEISYKKAKPDHLNVELFFPGGITEIDFTYNPHSKSTEITTIYSPD